MTDDPFGDVKTLTVRGVSLAYREAGAGEPVVFVHGGLSDLRTWENQVPAVAEAYRAIAYSRRYARPNADIPPGVDDQMQVHVDDLAEFVSAADAAPAHLVGNSWGAFICLLTALQHPGLVRSLVLEEPPVLPLFLGTPPRPLDVLTLLARTPRAGAAIVGFAVRTIEPVQKAFRRNDDEAAMSKFVNGVLGADVFAALSVANKQQMRDNLTALKAQQLGAGFPPLTARDVRSISCPTLLLTGQRSPSFLLRLSARLGELLPDVKQERVPSASHLMHQENPAAVNHSIMQFLASRTAS